MADEFCVVTFKSTHAALSFEKTVKEKLDAVKIIPVPRQISASCGLAGMIREEEIQTVKAICKANDIEYEGIYLVYKDRTKKPEKLEG